MSDEFDEIPDPPPRTSPTRPAELPVAQSRTSASRLVARLYAAANLPQRASLLACLMRPLGPLAVAGVAAGAFAGFLNRRAADAVNIDLDSAARVSGEQVLELARFVEQVNPQALQQFADLISGSPLGLATFSASALVLLYRTLHASPAWASGRDGTKRRSRTAATLPPPTGAG
jgi:hypothetical protein